MLRDYAQNANRELVDSVVNQFVGAPERPSIVEFSELSPDSFIWKLAGTEAVYYLYAEDYVPSLEHVETEVRGYIDPVKIGALALEFLEVNAPVTFEDASPVRAAAIYQTPENPDELTKYGYPTGYDFAFLLRSEEKL